MNKTDLLDEPDRARLRAVLRRFNPEAYVREWAASDRLIARLCPVRQLPLAHGVFFTMNVCMLRREPYRCCNDCSPAWRLS